MHQDIGLLSNRSMHKFVLQDSSPIPVMWFCFWQVVLSWCPSDSSHSLVVGLIWFLSQPVLLTSGGLQINLKKDHSTKLNFLWATGKTSTFHKFNTILESKHFHVEQSLLLLSCRPDTAIYLVPLQSQHHYVPKDEGIFLQSSQVDLAWRL